MFQKKQENGWWIRVGLGVFLLLAPAVFMNISCGCCKTEVFIGVVRSEFFDPTKVTTSRGGPYDVWICPGDSVTIYWATNDHVADARITELGSVSIPKGFRVLYPTVTTKYTIVGRDKDGGCEVSHYCTVNVVEDNTTALIAAQLSTQIGTVTSPRPTTCVWTKRLDPDVWSPHLVVTGIRMLPFPQSDQAWNQPVPWNLHKTDGDIFDVPFRWDVSCPWAPRKMYAVGSWLIYPIGGEFPNKCPILADFEITLRCE